MFDDFSVFEAVEVRYSRIGSTWPTRFNMHYSKVAFDNDPLDLELGAWRPVEFRGEHRNSRRLAIRHVRIVLNVMVRNQVVECSRDPFFRVEQMAELFDSGTVILIHD